MGTRVIENRTKYQIMGYACAGIHFIFTVLMLYGQIYSLAILNMIATTFYAIGVICLSFAEPYKILFIATLIEVEINASISSILLGDGYEFMIYTLSMIPGTFYLAHTLPDETKNKRGISVITIVATFVISVMYVLVDFLGTIIPPVYDGVIITETRPFFHYFNILIAVFFLLSFSILFALEVRYIQKLLYEENSKLGEIASKDPLTKTLNRRSFNNILNEMIVDNEHNEFGLIILDIDDFKKVNDTYGHNVGDLVLVETASVMQENIAQNDYLCRWGGEEFLILIHGKKEEFENVAEKIRTSIEKLTFTSKGTNFAITATLGISEYQTGIKAKTLVEMADQKLYYGKQHGKNQVVK